MDSEVEDVGPRGRPIMQGRTDPMDHRKWRKLTEGVV